MAKKKAEGELDGRTVTALEGDELPENPASGVEFTDEEQERQEAKHLQDRLVESEEKLLKEEGSLKVRWANEAEGRISGDVAFAGVIYRKNKGDGTYVMRRGHAAELIRRGEMKVA